MNGRRDNHVTFADLDHDSGLPEPLPAPTDEFPLPAWYRTVRNTPLEELTIEDISKALRQHIHLSYVVPIALKILQSEPLAGEMYDGELLASFTGIDQEFWTRHPSHADPLRAIITSIPKEVNAELESDIAKLMTKLSSADEPPKK